MALTVNAIIEHMDNSNMLARGAKERLLKESARSRAATPAEAVAELADFLFSPESSGYWKPGFTWPETHHGLMQVLEIMPLDKGSRDKLSDLLHLDLAGRSPGERAKGIVRFLNKPTNHGFLAPTVRPEVPARELRVREAIRLFKDDLRPDIDVDALVKSWAAPYGTLPQHRCNYEVAKALAGRKELHAYMEGVRFHRTDACFQPPELTPEQEAAHRTAFPPAPDRLGPVFTPIDIHTTTFDSEGTGYPEF